MNDVTDYSDPANWAFYAVGEGKRADVFLIAPTVDTKDEFHMSLSDEENMERFRGALEMQRGMYEDECRLFAPYYRQTSLKVFIMEEEEARPHNDLSFSDISAAFQYYLENENGGRPIVLAGFSQGSSLCYRLLEEFFGDPELYRLLVATYAPGFAITEQMVRDYPQIIPAEGESDVGVVISFDTESPDVEETVVNPKGRHAYSINPLNWRTDSTPAGPECNLGACIMRSNGEVKAEIPNFCGCYIDPDRGALKLPEVDPKRYRPLVSFFPEGAFHVYDYEFFYYNLKENVRKRIDAYMSGARGRYLSSDILSEDPDGTSD
jgi:hypothetical protein